VKQSHDNSILNDLEALALADAPVATDALVRPVERSSTARFHPRTLPFFRDLCGQSVIVLALALVAPNAFGQGMSKGMMSPPANVRPPYLENVGIEQHLDAQVPPDLGFTDDTGRGVKLGDYFGKKPLILNLVYYKCPMLCGEALAGLSASMKMIKFDVGNEFEVVTVSFNPKETTADAAAKKSEFVKRYGRPGAAAGWHFLTGSAESINSLTKAVGFQYQYDAARNQYAHATAIMVLTPQGHISRYFYGVDFPPKDLRMGLVEASHEKIGNAVDQVLLYCYHYDPATGKYGAMVSNMLKLGGGLTIVFVGGLLLILFRLERIAPRRPWDETKPAHSGLKQTGHVL
jgi:protein SCO1